MGRQGHREEVGLLRGHSGDGGGLVPGLLRYCHVCPSPALPSAPADTAVPHGPLTQVLAMISKSGISGRVSQVLVSPWCRVLLCLGSAIFGEKVAAGDL